MTSRDVISEENLADSIAEKILSDIDGEIENKQIKLYGNEIKKETRVDHVALCLGKLGDGTKREIRIYNNGVIYDVDISSSGHETTTQINNAQEEILRELLGFRRGIRKKTRMEKLTVDNSSRILTILGKNKNT